MLTLFVVRHQHEAARCPAQDPSMGATLLNYLSRPNVRRHGIEIQGEAVVRGKHTLFMIVKAPDEERVREFMQPFEMAGTVEVLPALTCAGVVASGGCEAMLPLSDTGDGVLDPEEACQHAIDAGLVVHRAYPLNCETSIPALIGGVVMPNAHFYVRNHFQIPDLNAERWRLRVGGLVERPLELSLQALKAMPAQTQVVTLECAGNGRAMLNPPVDGEPWDVGAVSTAEWTGVPLVEVLDRAGVRAGGREVLFRGADGGAIDGRGEIRFERSLRLDGVRDSRALLAYAMNGEPLPLQHGYPLRLIVPGWYAVASVKWLTDIEVVETPFDGYYQEEKYQFEREEDGRLLREPVTLQRVRSLITDPRPDQHVESGVLTVRGVAWSGAAPIARVEVSVDGGDWQEGRLVSERSRNSWQWWELITRVERPGTVRLRSRATDMAGRTQPERPEWNRHGYGNNQMHEVAVTVAQAALRQ